MFFDIEELSNDFVEYVNYIKDLSLPHEYIFVSIKNFNLNLELNAISVLVFYRKYYYLL